MPFTPFHLGPGILIKGIIPGSFSLSSFALANAAMDVEPLYHLWRSGVPLHGASHSLLGAGLIGVGVALFGRPLIARAWRAYGRLSASAGQPVEIGKLPMWTGALLGTGSHVLLDAVMHTDVQLFFPTAGTPLLNVPWTQNVYLGCILSGMLGMLFTFIRAVFQRKPA